jgi:hypothetical protein
VKLSLILTITASAKKIEEIKEREECAGGK